MKSWTQWRGRAGQWQAHQRVNRRHPQSFPLSLPAPCRHTWIIRRKECSSVSKESGSQDGYITCMRKMCVCFVSHSSCVDDMICHLKELLFKLHLYLSFSMSLSRHLSISLHALFQWIEFFKHLLRVKHLLCVCKVSCQEFYWFLTLFTHTLHVFHFTNQSFPNQSIYRYIWLTCWLIENHIPEKKQVNYRADTRCVLKCVLNVKCSK